MEIFTQPCAEQRKSLVEQTEEITVESLLESNDIQPLGNKLQFLVAPRPAVKLLLLDRKVHRIGKMRSVKS